MVAVLVAGTISPPIASCYTQRFFGNANRRLGHQAWVRCLWWRYWWLVRFLHQLPVVHRVFFGNANRRLGSGIGEVSMVAVLVAEQGIAGRAECAAGGTDQPAGQRMLRLDMSLNRAYVHIYSVG
jgi:hypothetical protein